jgi:hypothetical protein
MKDFVRLRYVEALSRRMAGQQEPVQAILRQKLQAAMESPSCGELSPEKSGVSSSAPLTALNEYIRRARPRDTSKSLLSDDREPDELASVRRFRSAWDSSHLQDQVAVAASRRPTNAGPLNSHALVLQSLSLMGALSPEYLRRFLVHVESLQWLEQASTTFTRDQPGAPKVKKARNSKAPKNAAKTAGPVK